MLIFPAIDLFDGKAVRLLKGDYNQMTVYSENPPEIARDFAAAGATAIHIVDLEGAKSGLTPNLDTVLKIKEAGNLFCEIGGGIRTPETVKTYLSAGIDRVILGTAALNDRPFLQNMLDLYGERIAVGVDMRDGKVAVKGWTETSATDALSFCAEMKQMGVKTLICTDISKDGAMVGTNRALYKTLSETLDLQITASGGVSTLDDIRYLAAMNLYGCIVGKAYYTGAIDLRQAIGAAE